jgi:hypothetical protein
MSHEERAEYELLQIMSSPPPPNDPGDDDDVDELGLDQDTTSSSAPLPMSSATSLCNDLIVA